jgi:hypothetical protein
MDFNTDYLRLAQISTAQHFGCLITRSHTLDTDVTPMDPLIQLRQQQQDWLLEQVVAAEQVQV